MDYLISTEPGEHHALEISWTADRSLIFISTNSRTMGMSPSMATELMKGLMALLQGPFDRAISETALTQEQFFVSARAARSAPAEPSRREMRAETPNLDQL